MPLQPHLFPDPAPTSPESPHAGPAAAGASTEPPAERAAAAPIWLQRISLFILVLFCVYIGVLVAVLPWWSRVWDHNLWMLSHPPAAAILHNGAVRGLISGLGLLDIWIGISEAVHYHDFRG